MGIMCNKWWLDGSQKPFVRIKDIVSVQAFLAQPV